MQRGFDTNREYAYGDVRANRNELLWSMFERAHQRTLHELRPKHLDRCRREFAGRHNPCDSGTINQIRAMTQDTVGKRFRYEDLAVNTSLALVSRT